jgi:hypothetical protein
MTCLRRISYPLIRLGEISPSRFGMCIYLACTTPQSFIIRCSLDGSATSISMMPVQHNIFPARSWQSFEVARILIPSVAPAKFFQIGRMA